MATAIRSMGATWRAGCLVTGGQPKVRSLIIATRWRMAAMAPPEAAVALGSEVHYSWRRVCSAASSNVTMKNNRAVGGAGAPKTISAQNRGRREGAGGWSGTARGAGAAGLNWRRERRRSRVGLASGAPGAGGAGLNGNGGDGAIGEGGGGGAGIPDQSGRSGGSGRDEARATHLSLPMTNTAQWLVRLRYLLSSLKLWSRNSNRVRRLDLLSKERELLRLVPPVSNLVKKPWNTILQNCAKQDQPNQ